MDFSSYKKISDVLVINFKAMFSARVEVPKKDFYILLAGKPQNCRVRGPLTVLANNTSGNVYPKQQKWRYKTHQ